MLAFVLACEFAVEMTAVRIVISRAQEVRGGGKLTCSRGICHAADFRIAIVYCLTKAPGRQMAFFMNHLSNMFPSRWSGALKNPEQKW